LLKKSQYVGPAVHSLKVSLSWTRSELYDSDVV